MSFSDLAEATLVGGVVFPTARERRLVGGPASVTAKLRLLPGQRQEVGLGGSRPGKVALRGSGDL